MQNTQAIGENIIIVIIFYPNRLSAVFNRKMFIT